MPCAGEEKKIKENKTKTAAFGERKSGVGCIMGKRAGSLPQNAGCGLILIGCFIIELDIPE
jgi:hypothetical protein